MNEDAIAAVFIIAFIVITLFMLLCSPTGDIVEPLGW